MIELKQNIAQEIIDLHKIFVKWFTGTLNKKDLENKLGSRFNTETLFISTKGESIPYPNLMTMFENGYGKMSLDFKIAISNVELLHEIGAYILVNYIEWQTSDPNPQSSGNYTVRKTSALISKQQPFKWLHIHETMMPNPDNIIEAWRT